MRAFFLAVLIFLSLGGVGGGHQAPTREYACPVCSTRVGGFIGYSCLMNRIDLDFERKDAMLGASYLRRCPECGYISMHETVLSEEQREAFRTYASSGEYNRVKEWSPYFYQYALLEQWRGQSNYLVGHFFLYASWDWFFIHHDNRGLVSEADCFREALACFEAHVPNGDAPLHEKLLPPYYRVELNRRLGNFAEAAEWLEKTQEALDEVRLSCSPLSREEIDNLVHNGYMDLGWDGKPETLPRIVPPAYDLVTNDLILCGLLREFLVEQRGHIAARDSGKKALLRRQTSERGTTPFGE